MGSSHSKFENNAANRNKLSKPKTNSEFPKNDANTQTLSTSSVACLDVREPKVEAVSRRQNAEDPIRRKVEETGRLAGVEGKRRRKSFFRSSKKHQPAFLSSSTTTRTGLPHHAGESHTTAVGPRLLDGHEVAHPLHITPSRRHSQISYIASHHSRSTTPERIGIARGGENDNQDASRLRVIDGGVFPMRRRSLLNTPGIATRKSSLNHQQWDQTSPDDKSITQSQRPQHGRSQSQHTSAKKQVPSSRSNSTATVARRSQHENRGTLSYPEHNMPELPSLPLAEWNSINLSSSSPTNETKANMGNYRPGALRVINATPHVSRVKNDRGYVEKSEHIRPRRSESNSSLSSVEEVTYRRRFDPTTGDFVKYEVHEKPICTHVQEAHPVSGNTSGTTDRVVANNDLTSSNMAHFESTDVPNHKTSLSDFGAIGSIHHPIDRQSPTQAFEMAQDYIQRISSSPFSFDHETPRFTISPATAMRDVYEDEALNERMSQQSRASNASPLYRLSALGLRHHSAEDAVAESRGQYLQYNQQASRWERVPGVTTHPKKDSGYSLDMHIQDPQPTDAIPKQAARVATHTAETGRATEESTPGNTGYIGDMQKAPQVPATMEHIESSQVPLTLTPITMISSSPDLDTNQEDPRDPKRSSLPAEPKRYETPVEVEDPRASRHSFDTPRYSPHSFLPLTQSPGGKRGALHTVAATHTNKNNKSGATDQPTTRVITPQTNADKAGSSNSTTTSYGNTVTTTTTTTRIAPSSRSHQRNLSPSKRARSGPQTEQTLMTPVQHAFAEYTYEGTFTPPGSDRVSTPPPVSMVTRGTRFVAPRSIAAPRVSYVKTSMHVLDEFARSRHERRSPRQDITNHQKLSLDDHASASSDPEDSSMEEPHSSNQRQFIESEFLRPWSSSEATGERSCADIKHVDHQSSGDGNDVHEQELGNQAPQRRAVFSPILKSSISQVRSYSMPRQSSKAQTCDLDERPSRTRPGTSTSYQHSPRIRKETQNDDMRSAKLATRALIHDHSPSNEAIIALYDGRRFDDSNYDDFDFGEAVKRQNMPAPLRL